MTRRPHNNKPSQFRIVLKFLACIAVVLTVQLTVDAQQIIINGKGEKIVIYPDGSWRHYEDADSVLVRKNTHLDDVVTKPDHQMDNGEGFRNPSRDDEESLRQSMAFIEKLRMEELQIRQALRTATTRKFDVQVKLDEALENRDLVEPALIDDLEASLEENKQAIKAGRKQLKKLEKLKSKASRLPGEDPEKRYTDLQKLLVRYKGYKALKADAPTPQLVERKRMLPADKARADGVVTSDTEANPAATTADAAPVKLTSTAQEIQEKVHHWAGRPPSGYTRAPIECQYSSISRAQGAGAGKIETQPTLIFTHTDDELRPYFGDEELVTCYAYLTDINDNVYLTLEFRIASSNAQKNFGPLMESALLRVKLLNGIFVNLYNNRYDGGQIDPYSGHTLYTGRYFIGKSESKTLQKDAIEFMRVVWGTGFEDYPVYDLDFFINQFSCLESVK